MAGAEATADLGHEVEVERGVAVPMRDGVVLRAEVYRPKAPGRYPVVLERVAYELSARCREDGEYLAARGYVFVGQNVRGAFASGGAFTLLRDDGWGARQDGYDSVEWAAAQPWSDGKVALLGGSYSGFTQYLVAPARPPHLRTLFVREAGGDVYRDLVFRDGAYMLALGRSWVLGSHLLPQSRHPAAPPGSEAAREEVGQAVADLERWLWHLPLADFPAVRGRADWHLEHLGHPDADASWQATDATRHFAEVDVPIFHLGGWFDVFLGGTLRAFTGLRRGARTEAARRGQRLLIGPWIHGPGHVGDQVVGDLDFGPDARFDLPACRLRWYDHWLKGIANGAADGPPVRVFLMGANRWLDLPDWPPPGSEQRPLYFQAGSGPDAASLNHGGLGFQPPPADEPPDRYRYDPDHPVPSLMRYPQLGPTDHRPVEGRMLTYTTPPLERDLSVVGPVGAVLYAASSARDTDWVVRLCDVWPDGRSLSVCDGILRARYRHSLARPEPLAPGQVERFAVDLWATAQVFRAGHRLRVEVTSSDFPRYDRNLNTGGPIGQEARGVVAENTVCHDAEHPSHLLLPLWKGDEAG